MFKRRSVKGQKRLVTRKISDSDSSDVEREIIVKKQKAVINNEETKLVPKESESTDKATLTKNDDATKVDTLNQEIIDLDRKKKTDENEEEQDDDGTYKGKSNYTKFIKPKSNMDKKGPKKQASNVRSTTIFDFQRDVCKDYKQTGFCGYGDSCKFLHARDDFKAGWKLNKEWDLESKAKQQKLENKLKDIPFKCVICKEDYKNPIKTLCDHYFCELCFLNRNKKNPKCTICGKNTNGTALPAKDLKEMLKQSVQTVL